eukprot:412528-Amphidinium_carterae.1
MQPQCASTCAALCLASPRQNCQYGAARRLRQDLSCAAGQCAALLINTAIHWKRIQCTCLVVLMDS